MRLVFIFVASIDSVINFRVRLEDVYCGSNEVILVKYSKKWVSKFWRVRGKQKVQFSLSFANGNGKPQCLVRLQVVPVPKEFLFKEELQHQTWEKIQEIPRKISGNSRKAILRYLEGNQAHNQGETGKLLPPKRLCTEDVVPSPRGVWWA